MNLNRREFLVRGAAVSGSLVAGAALRPSLWAGFGADPAASSGTKRYLYVSLPDTSVADDQFGIGVLVFDVDDGHRLVRRIDLPREKHGLVGFAGFTGCLRTHCAYYSIDFKGAEKNVFTGRVGCFDLESERIVWERAYAMGVDRSSVTLDGRKLYVPTGSWYEKEDGGLPVFNGENGELIKRIVVGPMAHNTIVSLDGRFLYLESRAMLTVFDTRDERVIRQIKGVGDHRIAPFTVDSGNRRAYYCLHDHLGFDVVDLEAGKVLHRVYVGGTPIPHRTHGVGLTPDEKELWVSDQIGRRLLIYDATQDPPTPIGQVALSQGGHGWIKFSLDGRYAWPNTADVIDTVTRKTVATLRDERGLPVSSAKCIEVQFRDGKVVAMGNEFGLGRRFSAGPA